MVFMQGSVKLIKISTDCVLLNSVVYLQHLHAGVRRFSLPLDMTEEELAEELRKKYMLNPQEGMTSDDIRYMSVGDLLDMDYFLNDKDDDDVGEEGFYIF